MIFYRGNIVDEESEKELQTIIEHAEKSGSQKKQSFQGNLQIFTSPVFLRPFRCVGLLYILYCMSGMFILATYTHTFLEVYMCIAD